MSLSQAENVRANFGATPLKYPFNSAADFYSSGLYPAILGKASGQNWEKMINLVSKLGKIIDTKHSLEQNLS